MTASIAQVSPDDLSTRLEKSGSAPLLLDVRTPLEYQEIHLPHSRIQLLDEASITKLVSQVGRDRDVAVICRSGKRAEKAAAKLITAGMTRVSVLEGGMLAWAAAGLPATYGRKVVSLERQVRIAAGLFVLIGVALGTLVNPAFYGLSAFVGAGLVFAGVTDWCGMGLLLAKAPWNKSSTCPASLGSCGSSVQGR